MNKTEIKKLRLSMNLTQYEMAERLGLGAKTYWRWEKGTKPSEAMRRYLVQFVALNRIMTRSYDGTNNNCLDCGAINEIADWALKGVLI